MYLREASIQEKGCNGTSNLGKLFILISYILAWTVSKRHWLLRESIGTTALENEAYTTIWTTLIVAIFLLIVGPILACKLYKKIITTLHPSYQIVEEEIKTEKAQRTKEKCWGILSSCSNKEDQETKEKCWGLFSRCSKLRSSCVCSGEKEATARSTEEVEDAELNV